MTGEGVTGVLERYALFAFRSTCCRATWTCGFRRVTTAEQAKTRFPVLYMHDGQNLFDPERLYGGVDWGVDESVTGSSAKRGAARERSSSASGTRPSGIAEYMPLRGRP